MKSYKLNKTFENSMYPVTKELLEIRKSTQKTVGSLLGNIAATIFSGIATSLAFTAI